MELAGPTWRVGAVAVPHKLARLQSMEEPPTGTFGTSKLSRFFIDRWEGRKVHFFPLNSAVHCSHEEVVKITAPLTPPEKKGQRWRWGIRRDRSDLKHFSWIYRVRSIGNMVPALRRHVNNKIGLISSLINQFFFLPQTETSIGFLSWDKQGF